MWPQENFVADNIPLLSGRLVQLSRSANYRNMQLKLSSLLEHTEKSWDVHGRRNDRCLCHKISEILFLVGAFPLREKCPTIAVTVFFLQTTILTLIGPLFRNNPETT